MSVLAEKSVYYISARPETYELWGEVDHDMARRLADLIVERTAKRFPTIEFRIDEDWHMHPSGLEIVSTYIDDHLQTWVAEVSARAQAA